MLTACSAVRCWSEAKDKMVGTSTNCSAICGSRRSRSTKRGWMMSFEIVGTSITCSTGNCVSRDLKKWCTSCSPSCGTGSSRICTKGRWRPRAPRCAAAPAPAAQGPRLAATLRCLRQTARSTPHPRPLPSSTCRSLPRLWQSSVPVGQCGGSLLEEPQASLLSLPCGPPCQRDQQACQSLKPYSQKMSHREKATL